MTIARDIKLDSLRSAAQQSQADWLLPLHCLAGALWLWATAVPFIDPAGITDFGLVAILPWQLWMSLLLLATGFAFSLRQDLVNTPLPLAYLFALVIILHLTPALVYETVRYPWVWKHIGMVDFIQRHGAVDRNAEFLQAYQNWPGLFYVSAWVGNVFGLGVNDFAQLSRFAPVASQSVTILALIPVLKRFSSDPRIIWLAIWIFLAGNWIGQDYYSPQAISFILFLVILGLCLGPLRNDQMTAWPKPIRLLSVIAFAVLVLALVATHQLTPIALILALLALCVARQLNFTYALFAIAAEFLWLLHFASPFVARNLAEEFATFGSGIAVASERIADASLASAGQWWVVVVGRASAIAIAACAVLGAVKRLRAGFRDTTAAVLALSPLPLLVTSYGGEVLFRVYLFALPFLAFFGATAFFTAPIYGRSNKSKMMVAIACGLFASAFYFANNGKDRQYTFSAGEVAASRWIYEHAPRQTLLIEGGREYPSQFMNYENISFVPFDREAPEERARIAAQPAEIFSDWMSDSRWSAAYVIITRSHKISAAVSGALPMGALDRIEAELLRSPKFVVVMANDDARVFALSRPASNSGDGAALSAATDSDIRSVTDSKLTAEQHTSTGQSGMAVTALSLAILLLFQLALNLRLPGKHLLALALTSLGMFSATLVFAIQRILFFVQPG